ncbi:hypothetical protein ACH437_03755 [Streptomyces xinghaiensis]|uniref:hypothetical protein n=1 Tax=Streptomyces xinghaiensis TaxID=1038928 RepID=UPI00378C098E
MTSAFKGAYADPNRAAQQQLLALHARRAEDAAYEERRGLPPQVRRRLDRQDQAATLQKHEERQRRAEEDRRATEHFRERMNDEAFVDTLAGLLAKKAGN